MGLEKEDPMVFSEILGKLFNCAKIAGIKKILGVPKIQETPDNTILVIRHLKKKAISGKTCSTAIFLPVNECL